jgi:beta-glucosidase
MLVSIAASKVAAQSTLPRLEKNNIKEIVAAMTLEEKAKLVVGTGMRFGGNGPVIGDADGRIPGAAGNTFSIARLGIPGTVMADGPAGIRIEPFRKKDSSRSYYATAWPVGSLLASSWDTNLIKKVGVAFGNEIKEYGVDIILAPGMNIHRNPLCGRNFEYFSEDPLMTGQMAAAIINGIQSNGVGVSVKHFAVNNQESNRNNVNAIVSERALREIYLKGFEIAVKQGHPLTVMSSYNKINGSYTSESYDLLTTILRKEWGFNGLVMTDWFGGKDPVAQMKAGNDLIMPGTPQQIKKIIDAVNNGSLDSKVLDENVERILQVVVQLPSFEKYKFSDKPDLTSHVGVARTAAAESMVLLKNESGALPLKASMKLALFGNSSYDLISGGTGSGDVNEAYTISLLQGLQKTGYGIQEQLSAVYTAYLQKEHQVHPKPALILGPVKMIPELVVQPDYLSAAAVEAEAAVVTIGRNAGEGADRKIDKDFNLSDSELVLLKNVTDAFHAKGKKVIVVLNIGGVIETASWRNVADAILLVWQPGQEGGNAIADVLSGKVNPCGKLATTFPVKYEDVPSAGNFPGTPAANPASVTYEEGIYVGYRYYSSFHVQPAYEFGYGLSYTGFSYSNLKLSQPMFKNKMTTTVTITNTGNMAGREIVQLYVNAPSKNINKPAQELKAFAKTKLLQPGEAQKLTFTLLAKDLASFDSEKSGWVADAGNYSISIGASSADIKLSATCKLSEDMLVEKVNKALAPQVNINELKK